PSGDMGLYSAGGNGGTVSARGYLRYHNYYRKRHAVQELSWQTKLQAAAQEAANRCKFEHTHGQWGENIYASTSDPPVSEVVGSWYNEVNDFGSGGFSEATGHFTQIVWSDTDAVGCAKAKCSGNDLGFGSSFGEGYVVFCEYNPPGNVLGEFQQEVAAPQAASSDRAVRTKNNGSKSSSRRSSYRKSQSWHSGTT
ncbi:PR-1-like protein, partial [Ceraceosorus guamensis]